MRNLTVLICTAVLLSGCGRDKSVTDPMPRPLEPVRPFTAQELTVASDAQAFGFAMLQRIAAAESSPNLMISPLSASMALGMTLNGAEGATFNAMRDVLGFDGMQQPAVNEAYRGLIAQLHARDPKVEFRLANAIWHRGGFEVKQPFLDAASTYFDARVGALDFNSPEAPRTISRWAEEQTGGRIKNLVEEIDANDMLFLVNAVYFKAPWAVPFQPGATRAAPFARAAGGSVDVPMMTNDAAYRHLQNDDVHAVELFYADSAFSMVVLMPASADASLASLTAGLTPQRWNAWLNAMQPGRVMLSLPKFRFDYDIVMNDALKALGMAVAFDPQNADFDAIHDQTRDDLFISQVRQKAFIDVHELGTEAAAATSVTVSVTSMPPVMKFDRPFLFAIRERSSGSILFIGRVGDPSGS